MDKRLSIALLLTAIIVAVTPVLFPTSRRPPPATSAVTPTRNAEPATPERSLPVTSPTVPFVVGSVIDTSVTSPSMQPVVPPRSEVTTVLTATTEYQFTNVGAAPVSAVFREYKNLGPAKGPVDLRIPGRPLLRYSLVSKGDTVPLYATAFKLLSSQGSGGNKVLTYRASVNGLGVVVSYEIAPDKYSIAINGRIEGAAGSTYLLVDLPSSLPTTEADTLSDLRTLSYSFKPSRDHARGVPFSKLDPGEKRLEAGPLTWAAVRNKYFVIGLVNPEGSAFEEMTLTGGVRTSKIATTASATAVKAVKGGAFAFDMYIGPQQSTQLLAMGRDFDNVNPYGWSALQPVVNPIAALCIKLLLWMHKHLNLSYGWVLVIFGVVIRVALWPLNQSAMRSSMKMQEIQPRLAEVQKKYKDKPERQREEMMKTYKEAGASPFTALSGCLPMLIPMPVLFALFFVFQNTIEFRGVPFLWLTDISIKDPIYILPVLMGISMYLLSWIGLRNAPPNPQAKMMSYMFPVMMTFVLANMASGLNLYYTAQNIAALPQQWMLARERQKARRTG
ncbi:MAG: membrane protein insertase YidC [Gemmatimonadaceae bacterium]|nr:membrane protein insertase YidC [Gemmatimonadaceae bacterium]